MQPMLSAIDECLSKNDLKRAEVLIAKALRGESTDQVRSEILFRRARARLLSGRPEDALDDLESIRETQAGAPSYLELLADCFLARFELASVGFADRSWVTKAQGYYQQIIDTFPDYINLGWVWYQLGRTWVILDQVDQAVACFHQSFLAPTTVRALTAFCYERLSFIAFYEQRDMTRALGYLNRAVDTYPPSEPLVWLVQVHLRRSRVLRQMQDYPSALDAAEKALSIVTSAGSEARPALVETLFTLAELLTSIGGRDREVINYLQQFLQISKRPLGVDVTWSRVYEMLGDAYLNSGDYTLAAGAYRAALQFNPDHPWEASLQYRLAKSLYQARDYTEAEQILERVTAEMASGNTASDFRVFELLGSAQLAQAKYEAAASAYQRALALDPPEMSADRIKTYLTYARERLS